MSRCTFLALLLTLPRKSNKTDKGEYSHRQASEGKTSLEAHTRIEPIRCRGTPITYGPQTNRNGVIPILFIKNIPSPCHQKYSVPMLRPVKRSFTKRDITPSNSRIDHVIGHYLPAHVSLHVCLSSNRDFTAHCAKEISSYGHTFSSTPTIPAPRPAL